MAVASLPPSHAATALQAAAGTGGSSQAPALGGSSQAPAPFGGFDLMAALVSSSTWAWLGCVTGLAQRWQERRVAWADVCLAPTLTCCHCPCQQANNAASEEPPAKKQKAYLCRGCRFVGPGATHSVRNGASTAFDCMWWGTRSAHPLCSPPCCSSRLLRLALAPVKAAVAGACSAQLAARSGKSACTMPPAARCL